MRRRQFIAGLGSAAATATKGPTTAIPIVCQRVLVALGFVLGLAASLPAQAKIWDWSYSAPGIAASGTLTTADTADGEGFYVITGITGTRNGETITGLQRRR
jgi:hypothetical protein